jgi:hypothetical protein
MQIFQLNMLLNNWLKDDELIKADAEKVKAADRLQICGVTEN